MGRNDDQVKIRGVRVEPGETQAMLASHPQVTGCVVLARQSVLPVVDRTQRGRAKVNSALPAAIAMYCRPSSAKLIGPALT